MRASPKTGSNNWCQRGHLDVDVSIERFHERIAQIFRHLLFQGSSNIMAGIGSRACRLLVPARIL